MADKLTLQQRQAVEDRGGRLLVSAAAGSGKTKVLVDRLMGYLSDPVSPANIDDFLMITYTKAAAAELRGKIAAKLSEKVAQEPNNRHLQRQLQRLYLTKISTVHAFCADILREYAYRLDIPTDFRVADENECTELRNQVLNQLLDEAYASMDTMEHFRALADSQGLGRDDRQLPEIIQKVYDSGRCHLRPQQWLDRCLELTENPGVTDAAQTKYGSFLCKRLQNGLSLQMEAMEACLQQVNQYPDCAKVSDLLQSNLDQMRRLRDCQSWDSVRLYMDIDFGRLNFPRNFENPELKERVKQVRTTCKKELEKYTKPFCDPSQQVLADLGASASAVRGLIDLVGRFSEAYDKWKRNRRVLDFGDLEHRMLDLLLGRDRTGATSAAHEIGARFREVMVDEYQDSNAVQDAIYDALTQKRQNLFMVGDVKQSIYQFRLADPGIFLKKYETYVPAAGASQGQGRKVMLSKNFRSSGGVLSGCNDVFSLCMCPEVGGLYYGAEEALYEGISHAPLPEPEVSLYCVDVREETYPEEASFVAEKILQLLDGSHYVRDGEALRPIQPEDIAILLRSPGSAGGYFQTALEQRGIRYATGGGEDLLQTQEVSTLRSTLQAIYNPRLDIPLIAAMSSPLFGFTADDLAAIRACNKKSCFYDALCMSKEKKAKDFLQKLTQLRAALRFYSVTGLLEELLLTTKLESLFGAMEGGDIRLENIHTFCQLAADFEVSGNRDLGRFLQHLDSLQEHGLITPGEQSSAGCVTIMSIHKSKGLEFPVVFLCNLSRKFNMESQRDNVLCHKEMGLGLSAVDQVKRIHYPTIAKRAIAAKIEEETISEELRVLYVAMTRARDTLIMTYASRNLEKELSQTVQLLNAGAEKSLIRQAGCPGDWILLTALHRIEAGALFALGGKPEYTACNETPWRIAVVAATHCEMQQQSKAPQASLPLEMVEYIRRGLSFQYAHTAATTAPSKQTATQRKGRAKAEEAAEDTKELPTDFRSWREPGFAQPQQTGKTYGNAMHSAMQYIDYALCNDEAAVQRELERLVREDYLSDAQVKMINPTKIAAFFSTDIGKKLQQGTVEREFKFSILEDGGCNDPALAGENVLLQGVVDCMLLEPDGITIIDFKTDRVTEDTIAAVTERYRSQLQTYADSVSRIYRMKIKATLLYYFYADRFAEI